VAARREVHDDAVVLVDSGKLPDDRDRQVPYGFEAAIRHSGRLCPALRCADGSCRTKVFAVVTVDYQPGDTTALRTRILG